MERGEGDLNSRGHKTKGLAILRRSQAGPSPLRKDKIIATPIKSLRETIINTKTCFNQISYA